MKSKPACITYIYDSPEYADRYTLYLNWDKRRDGTTPCLCLSGNPTSSQGFSQFSSGKPGSHNGHKITWFDLPENVQEHAVYRLTEDL